MKAGKLRHRLALQSGTASTDTYGAVTYAYTTYDTVWGSITPLRGLELIHAQQVQSEVTHKCFIRYNSTVTTTDRILFDSRTFEITSILNSEERAIYQEVWCKEIL